MIGQKAQVNEPKGMGLYDNATRHLMALRLCVCKNAAAKRPYSFFRMVRCRVAFSMFETRTLISQLGSASSPNS
jgi:hypothetical protein